MDKLRAYAQLLRIPNVFTAMADVCMGWMVAICYSSGLRANHPLHLAYYLEQSTGPTLWRLLAASACLYCSGMVWNDYFDVEEDRRERPFRPIPSGRVHRQTAGWLATVLLIGGIGIAASTPSDGAQSLLIGVSLATAILLYDAFLKHTWAGPLGMGLCRFLNVTLGMSGIAALETPETGLIAVAVGVYIVGVTCFARAEASASRPLVLLGDASIMVLGVGIAVYATAFFWNPIGARIRDDWIPDWNLVFYPPFWPISVGVLVVGLAIAQAIKDPDPKLVQRAVKFSILGLVALDAAIASAVVGWPGLLILLLLPPALLLGRWVYST